MFPHSHTGVSPKNGNTGTIFDTLNDATIDWLMRRIVWFHPSCVTLESSGVEPRVERTTQQLTWYFLATHRFEVYPMTLAFRRGEAIARAMRFCCCSDHSDEHSTVYFRCCTITRISTRDYSAFVNRQYLCGIIHLVPSLLCQTAISSRASSAQRKS